MSAPLVDLWFLAPLAALTFGLLALAPLGEQVLARGVVFIDLAVAQAAAAAAVWASALAHATGWVATQLAAVAGALACAGWIAATVRRVSQREALIGLVYVLGAAAALLGVRLDAHGRERLTELLAADLLWAQWPQAAALAICAALVAAARAAGLLARDAVFYALFAVCAALAVQALGVLLVFALLVAPALARRAGLSPIGAAALVALAAAGGLAASWVFDLPSGSCVTVAAALAGLMTALVSARPSRAAQK